MAKEKVGLSPAQISEKWGRRMKGAVTDIQNGIDNMTVNPMEKAIAKKDKMKQNLMASIDNGTWEKRMGEVSQSEWKEKTKQKVAERLSSGVDAGMPKRQKFDQWLVGRINEGLGKLQGMPDMTLEDSVNRVRTMMETMASQKYKSQ